MAEELSNEQAWERAQEHEGLLLKVVDGVYKKGVPASITFEDLKQEGWIALHRAVRQFDPDRGYRFSTFAVPVIRNAVVTAVRRVLAEQGANKGHAPLKYYAYVDSYDRLMDLALKIREYGSGSSGLVARVEEMLGQESFEDDLVRKLDADVWMDRLLSLDISERNLEMVLHRLEGAQYTAIAETYNLSTQRVEQIVKRAFDILRAMDTEQVAA